MGSICSGEVNTEGPLFNVDCEPTGNTNDKVLINQSSVEKITFSWGGKIKYKYPWVSKEIKLAKKDNEQRLAKKAAEEKKRLELPKRAAEQKSELPKTRKKTSGVVKN